MTVLAVPPRPTSPPTPSAPATVSPLVPAPVQVPFGPQSLLWTVADFHRIGETGIFDNRRPMLIHGSLLEQGMMKPPHATGVSLCSRALDRAFGANWYPRVQLPLVLGLNTDPMPDVAVVSGDPRDHAATHSTTAALVVEVSDTTLAFDLTVKAELYAAAGIADYWVLDLTGQRLLVFRDPGPLPAGGIAYRTHLTLGPNESVAPLAAPNHSIAVSGLLP